MFKKTFSFILVLFFLLTPHFVFANTQLGPVSIYFNHDSKSSYTEPYRKIQRSGDDLEAVFINAIHEAKKSIDLAVYELRLPNVAKALVEQSKRGIAVRIVLEGQNSRPLSDLTPADVAKLSAHDRQNYDDYFKLMDANGDGKLSADEILDHDALAILRNAHVQWIDDTADGSKGSGLMHHKFMVIDGKTTVVSSANLTLSCIHGDMLAKDSRGNSNGVMVFQSQELAQQFETEFGYLWAHQFKIKKPVRAPVTVTVGSTTVTVQFSPISKKYGYPASVNGLIEREILKTHRSADLAQFVFSEQQLVDDLQPLNESQGTIRALIDPEFAFRNYSSLLDMFGLQLLTEKCVYQTGDNPWKHPIHTGGIPKLPQGDLLHHKFAILDDERVIFGSHNWSDAANHHNDETLIVVTSKEVAHSFDDEFSRLYASADLGPHAWLLQKIKDQKKACGQ